MKLDDMEKQVAHQEEQTTFTVTHLATVRDEESGEISRVALTIPREDPDFHLGAVGGE